MKKRMKAQKSKVDLSESSEKTNITEHSSKKSIEINPRPFKNGKMGKFRNKIKKYKINHSHKKIVKKIDNSLGLQVNDTDFKEDLNTNSQEKFMITSHIAPPIQFF